MRYKLALIIGVFLMVYYLPCENWPGWRGTGDGVSNETGLPFEWSTERNILWKTSIDGHGISSPIVWKNRVFVTTAVNSQTAVTNQKITPGLEITAMILAVLFLIFSRKREQKLLITNCGPPHHVLKWGERIDRVISPLSIFLFFASICFILFKKDYIEPGAVGLAWRWTGASVIFALSAVFGSRRPDSPLRLMGVTVMIAALLIFRLAGPSRFGSTKELFVLGWSLLIIIWWSILFFAFHYWKIKNIISLYAPLWNKLTAVAFLLSALGLFLWVNYYLPQNTWTRQVICLDGDSGKLIWKQSVLRTPQLIKYHRNSYATPTPVTNGKYVIADFGPGIVCLDINGTVQWKKSRKDYTRHLLYGSAASPVIYGNLVISTFFPENIDHKPPEEYIHTPRVTALNTRTGTVVWEKSPVDAYNLYHSPVIGKINSVPMLFLVLSKRLLGLNPKDGNVLQSWTIPDYPRVPGLVMNEENAFIRGVALKLTASPVKGKGAAPFLWRISKNTPGISSPVLFDGLLYWVTNSGKASCLDASTGDILWQKKIGREYHASVCCGDGKVFFVSTKGDTLVLRAGRKYEVLAKNCIGESTQASLAFSDGKIFLRGRNHLFCIANLAR